MNELKDFYFTQRLTFSNIVKIRIVCPGGIRIRVESVIDH